MRFVDLEKSFADLRSAFNNTVPHPLVGDISVPAPTEPIDELHFTRLVAWCYVLLIEVAGPPIKHVQSILRGTDPNKHSQIKETIRVIQCLRTYQSHQLDSSKSDLATKNFVTTWMTQYSSEPIWENRCQAICAAVAASTNVIASTWIGLCKNQDQKKAIVATLLDVLNKQWPAHHFDRVIEEVASGHDIIGLNVVEYRKLKIEGWQKLIACFEERDAAEEAIKRVIGADFVGTFGATR